MKFSVNYRDLTDEQKASAQRIPKLVRGVKDAVRKVSFAVERTVKQAMPVDTGRARLMGPLDTRAIAQSGGR